ncbi:hypothetical protein WJX73_004493 [Symbiochloris irregularis]|uniref:Uncharacterized protein n=1 Tax=Symbiochloris irregularis TaxID=706552 RepID=A0AAW1NQ89_9CHLO
MKALLDSRGFLSITWTASAVLLLLGVRNSVTVQLRFLVWPALLAYALASYTAVRLYLAHVPSQLDSPLLLAVTTCLETCMVATIAVIETLRSPSDEEDDALKEALLGVDEEAPADAGPKQRSWPSLLLTALVYVWPEGRLLQVRALGCVVIVAMARLLNLAVPILYRDVVNTMADVSAKTHPPPGQPAQHFTFKQVFYPFVCLYMVASYLQGGIGTSSMGLLSNMRTWLWIPVFQAAYRRISLDLFAHTLDLDLKFHLMRKTGEVTRIMDRGTNALQNILSTVIFNIGPQMFDIVAACAYLATALQPWIALILFVTLLSYIPLTIYLTEWRGRFRRDMNRLDNAKSGRVTDALLNYETVKYFSNEPLEVSNLASAIGDYQQVEYKLLASLAALNVIQSAVIFSGLVAGLLVCTRGVANGSLTVGDAVLFITMVQQLSAPLNFFGSYYRQIQGYVIDMSNMFDLLSTSPSTQDDPDAKELVTSGQALQFDNVFFEYTPGNPVLHGVSFSIAGGKTLALVGETGSGKSTILRLLFRFYDPSSGCIRVDGQDIARVTQRSLRAALGVVPQDSVLFNDTIEYNIRYGRPGASREEVVTSCKQAALHSAVEEHFPEGYDTRVGERGLRLSGGEKQRVAFARAILRNPGILVLDEATSSLDSLTEHRIQAALSGLRDQRTTIIVAHRLSTIMEADCIVVLHHGRVLETGSHQELLDKAGPYAAMWSRQVEASRSTVDMSAIAEDDSQAQKGSSSGVLCLDFARRFLGLP